LWREKDRLRRTRLYGGIRTRTSKNIKGNLASLGKKEGDRIAYTREGGEKGWSKVNEVNGARLGTFYARAGTQTLEPTSRQGVSPSAYQKYNPSMGKGWAG